MCGIVGVLTRAPAVDEQADVLAELVRRMVQRGPDDTGTWNDGAHVAFGFRRLAVIDPRPIANQPMTTPDDRHVLVFNGELYDFSALRSRLEAEGVAFRTRSDTEVVLQALAYWGTAAIARFNGMFALAWYDRVERRLVLARDRFGIKPLYYGSTPHGVVFGSQYDQVFLHPWFRTREVDEVALGRYLRFGYLAAPHALFRDTFQVEPGSMLTVRFDRPVEVTRYMTFEPASQLIGGAEATERIKAAVTAAVRRQLVADVPVGTFLSGGIDSPLVTACAADASPGRVRAFTVGFEDPRLDESARARAYADAIGVDHQAAVFPTASLLAVVDEFPAAYSEPFADHSALATMLLSKLARDQVTVAMSGDGGDELLWGYPRFRKVLGASHLFRLPRVARAARYALGRVGAASPVPRGLLFHDVGEWYEDSHSGLRASDLGRICPDLGLGRRPYDEFVPDAVAGDRDSLAQWLRAQELGGHLQMMLTKVDRASMHYGLEVRVPLLDDEVVEAAAHLHPAACMDASTGKKPLRSALQALVPDVQPAVAKQGFDVPMDRWLRHELRPLVGDLLLGRDPFPHGVFDRAALATWTEDHFQERVPRTQGLWTLLSLQLWADRYLGSHSSSRRMPVTERAT